MDLYLKKFCKKEGIILTDFKKIKKTKVIKKKFNGIYNVGSHKGYSKFNFAIKFAKKMQLDTKNIIKVKYKDINFSAKRNRDMRMKVVKFEKKFNYKFKSLDFELEETVGEYKRN